MLDNSAGQTTSGTDESIVIKPQVVKTARERNTWKNSSVIRGHRILLGVGEKFHFATRPVIHSAAFGTIPARIQRARHNEISSFLVDIRSKLIWSAGQEEICI